MKNTIIKSKSRTEIKQSIDTLINNLNNEYNVYLHHIWGIKDKDEDIKKYIFLEGLNVAYKKSMMSTCMKINNPTSDNILDYFFSHKFDNRYIVVLAIPKQIEMLNGVTLPFSDNIKHTNQTVGDVANNTIISVYDACKKDKVDKEFVLMSVKTGERQDHEYELEINNNHLSFSNIHFEEYMYNYIEKVNEVFKIKEFDQYITCREKINNRIESLNIENVKFFDSYTMDFDFD